MLGRLEIEAVSIKSKFHMWDYTLQLYSWIGKCVHVELSGDQVRVLHH